MLAHQIDQRPVLLQTLDSLLSHGYFRMGRRMFTTNFLKFKDEIYSALWLRVDLENFVASSTHLKLCKQNARFRTEIKPLAFSDEQDQLFEKYRSSVHFAASPSVRDLLGFQEQDFFDSFEINVYDQNKLIATGFFDKGENAVAGISCFFDPDYKRFSLGKYLMFLKINYCLAENIQFFYPGYFAPGYPLFDYKLDLARQFTDYFSLSHYGWIRIDEPAEVPLETMKKQLGVLSNELRSMGVLNGLMFYDFFDSALMSSLEKEELLSFPLFVDRFHSSKQYYKTIAIFDPRDQMFKLFECILAYTIEPFKELENHYNEYLLRPNKILFDTPDAIEMATFMARL